MIRPSMETSHASPRWPVGARRRAIALTTAEAAAVGPLFACVEFWIVPLLQLRLGASAQVIGLSSVLPLLLMTAISPFVGSLIRHCGGNRRVLFASVLVQALAVLLLLAPALLPFGPWAIPAVVTLVTIFGVAGAFGSPTWVALTSEIVPQRLQGIFVARRLRLFLACKLASSLAFGVLMEWVPIATRVDGIAVILLLATTSRLCSALLVRAWMRMLPRPASGAAVSATMAMRQRPDLLPRQGFGGTIGRWLAVWTLLHCGVMISGPYFAPYMLNAGPEGLGLEQRILWYSVLMQVSQFTRMLVLPTVGRLVDRRGGPAVLRMALVGIVLVPLGWATCTSLWALLAVEFISGLAWCMAECAVAVLLFNCHPDPQRKASLVAIANAVTGLAGSIGGGCGGALLGVLPGLDGSPYRMLILTSALCRVPALVLGLLILPRLAAGEQRGVVWRSMLGNDPPITIHRGLLRFLRRPEG